jgi:hypothetical protein
MLFSIKNNVQRGIALKYYQKLLDKNEQEVKRFESQLNSCEVNLRQLKEKQTDLIEKMFKVECELHEKED